MSILFYNIAKAIAVINVVTFVTTKSNLNMVSAKSEQRFALISNITNARRMKHL